MLYVSKPWMVKNVIDLNIHSDTDIYYWVDFGGMRFIDNIGTLPLNDKVNNLFSGIPNDKLIFTTVSRKMKIKDYIAKGDSMFNYGVNTADFVIGTFFGGKSKSILWYYEEFYKLMRLWIQNRKFAGKEQDIMNGLAFRFPDRFLMLDLEGKYKNWEQQFYNHFWTYLSDGKNKNMKYKPILQMKDELK